MPDPRRRSGPTSGEHHGPAVSIVCITHRKGELLRRTLTRLADMLDPRDEVLVVDDGGDDAPVFRAVAAARPGARLRYVRVPRDGYRISLLCNIGVMLAASERIVKIDGDVMPRRGWLAAYRRRLRPGALVCGRIEWRRRDGRLARDSRFDYDKRAGCVGPRKSYGGNLGFLRADLLELGLFATEYHGAWGAEDAEIGEKYRASGRSVVFAFDAVAEHQWHPPSAYRAGTRRNRRLLLERVRSFAAGDLPAAVRRDVVHVVAGGATSHGDLESLIERSSLPCKLWNKPLAALARRAGAGVFALLPGKGRCPSPGTVDALYAHLKGDERCRGVASAPPPAGWILARGSAVGAAAAVPPSAIPVLPAAARVARSVAAHPEPEATVTGRMVSG